MMKKHLKVFFIVVASFVALVLLVVILILIATSIRQARRDAQLDLENLHLRIRHNWVLRTSERLAGGGKQLYIYNLYDADELLAIFAHRADIEDVSLEMTDVGPRGMNSLVNMPSLRSVSLSGVEIDDNALLLLEQCKLLENLDLICCPQLTDQAISQLHRFPALRQLTIQQGTEPRISSESLSGLASIGTLKVLKLGDWVSNEDMRELQRLLPNCEVQRYSWAPVAESGKDARFRAPSPHHLACGSALGGSTERSKLGPECLHA